MVAPASAKAADVTAYINKAWKVAFQFIDLSLSTSKAVCSVVAAVSFLKKEKQEKPLISTLT